MSLPALVAGGLVKATALSQPPLPTISGRAWGAFCAIFSLAIMAWLYRQARPLEMVAAQG